MANKIRILRKERGISGSELARRISAEPHTLRRWERGEVQPPDDMKARLSAFFGVSRETLLGLPELDISGVSGRVTIPVYGRAEGGTGVVNFDQAPIDHIVKPSYLETVDDSYALMVVGDSMEPRFYAGELLIVNPFRAPRQNDFVVVQFQSNNDLLAIAKRFVRHTEKHLTLRELNPDNEFKIASTDVVAVHYISSVRAV